MNKLNKEILSRTPEATKSAAKLDELMDTAYSGEWIYTVQVDRELYEFLEIHPHFIEAYLEERKYLLDYEFMYTEFCNKSYLSKDKEGYTIAIHFQRIKDYEWSTAQWMVW